MENPKRAGNNPLAVELEEGKNMPGALAACLKVSHFATDCTKDQE